MLPLLVLLLISFLALLSLLLPFLLELLFREVLLLLNKSFLDFLPKPVVETGWGGGVGVVDDNLGIKVFFGSADFDGGVSCFGEFEGDVSVDLCLYPVKTGLKNPKSLLNRMNLLTFFFSLVNLSSEGLALALLLDSEMSLSSVVAAPDDWLRDAFSANDWMGVPGVLLPLPDELEPELRSWAVVVCEGFCLLFPFLCFCDFFVDFCWVWFWFAIATVVVIVDDDKDGDDSTVVVDCWLNVIVDKLLDVLILRLFPSLLLSSLFCLVLPLLIVVVDFGLSWNDDDVMISLLLRGFDTSVGGLCISMHFSS